MDFYEKTIDSTLIYDGSFISLKVDKVLLPNGNISQRAIVLHSGAAVVVPVDDENNVIFVKQFRKPIEKVIIELPAGKLDKDENPLECAKRELEEETGYKASELIKLTEIYTTPGFSNEVIHVYLATGLFKGEVHTDADEFVEVLKIKMNDAILMVKKGEIRDAKTIIGLLLANMYLQEQGLIK
ncbi:ADP-ribose pyrophosphatase [Caldicellulosiruptor bescii]|uniref:NUDIX hydrolase n=2 Tax=Caldicellulosiruptor bescii TaxID=31899 RepID=B9MRY8_CALBD|nr:NUDIX hydrolase [Caldicellulosiruptor bescii]ACM60442.1 NUDIX hydrolase [Caldicellulosiruptor bescii DSM 6725]PBC87856.1 ADP-ribose pyrophosphatase [Caldicellulosiruptor bescii]PBC90788.1 ADP-ribose pyrophosphatase [Caldicellulosiruptor bescii]PBD03779.1 ADP-ribose pyrophosphatase [Caldicellulosiruptor bescii]PBD06586.1 ADP-ribose pyrophosphatase [Caldicellulosiruptor bescii]